MSDLVNCRFCGLPIQRIDGYWIVNDPETTADGLSYCPPNPDHQGELGWHRPPCAHQWVGGMMIVHPEELDQIAAVRKVVCSKCDEQYDPKSHR